MGDGFEKAVQIAKHKPDLIAIRITDQREVTLPDIGLVRVVDAETGEKIWINTGNKSVRRRYNHWAQTKTQELDIMFNRLGVDVVKINTGEDYVKPLIMLFKKREARS
jgi:hypothetical protein